MASTSMKKGQSVITLTFKDNAETYLFGSLSAIYALFSADQLGISYPSLRNAVSTYIKSNGVKEDGETSSLIYDTKNSLFTLRRAKLILADRTSPLENNKE